MENVNTGYPQQEDDQKASGPSKWNDQNQIVNEQDQNRPINTGDQDYKENVTGRTQEESPRDLNLTGSGGDKNSSVDTEGGAEVETPHRHEADDEESTERKIPKM